ncbi:MAG: hypothetical protein FWE66_05365, partial [Oscillospiraceae bacterium]|nr:hypothetical protein [Oscillospiraceae bacterium]
SIKRLQKKYPGFEICLLIGGDMLESFSEWSRFRRVLSKAFLVVAAREPEDSALLEAARRIERCGGRLLLLGFEPLVISSSEIRDMIGNNVDVSAYVDGDVLRYIEKHGLYRASIREGI